MVHFQISQRAQDLASRDRWSDHVETHAFIVLLCATGAAPSAENWPQWRGPSLNG